MTDTTARADARAAGDGRTSKPATSIPVLWWAALGGVILLFQIYVWTRWFVTGNARPTPVGPDVQPTWMSIVQLVTQIVMPIVLVATFYLFVVKPWRREGRMSRNGMLWLSWLLLWFWDPLLNYTQNLAAFNPNMVNLGSWTQGSFPGWVAPRTNFHAEPLLMMPAVYAGVLFPAVLGVAKIMTRIRDRGYSPVANVAITTAVMTVLSIVLEGLIFMPLGFYTLGGSIEGLSIFHGQYFQFPLYHAVLFGAWCAASSALVFFVDAEGRTMVERGIDRVRAAEPVRSLLRFLALFACTVLMVAIYWVPIQFFAVNSSAWPESITSKSYFTSNLCGGDTGYACPGETVPMPRPGSGHLTPDGTFVPAP